MSLPQSYLKYPMSVKEQWNRVKNVKDQLDLFYLFELIFLNYVLYYSILFIICQVKSLPTLLCDYGTGDENDHRKTEF